VVLFVVSLFFVGTLHGKQQTIDLNDLKKGIYFIRIYSGKDIIIRTIIKE
jgi:hypothetical protein